MTLDSVKRIRRMSSDYKSNLSWVPVTPLSIGDTLYMIYHRATQANVVAATFMEPSWC